MGKYTMEFACAYSFLILSQHLLTADCRIVRRSQDKANTCLCLKFYQLFFMPLPLQSQCAYAISYQTGLKIFEELEPELSLYYIFLMSSTIPSVTQIKEIRTTSPCLSGNCLLVWSQWYSFLLILSGVEAKVLGGLGGNKYFLMTCSHLQWPCSAESFQTHISVITVSLRTLESWVDLHPSIGQKAIS